MAHPTPILLFRTWSDGSHGTNSNSLFEPASDTGNKSTSRVDRTPESINGFGEELRLAIVGKPNPHNRFVFFSSSLLFVLQCAGWLQAKGQQNIRITCINGGTAMVSKGRPAKFCSVNTQMKRFNVVIPNRDGSLRQYSDEYVAITSVIAGAGSRTISFDTLISNGLFKLYPQLEAVNARRNVKWYRAVADLREFEYSNVQVLSGEKIDVAARLVFAFGNCTNAEDIATMEAG